MVLANPMCVTYIAVVNDLCVHWAQFVMPSCKALNRLEI